MLGNTAHFLANQLKILSAIAADPKNGHVMPKLHIVLVSDSKIDIVNTVLKPAGISLKQVGATHADGALNNNRTLGGNAVETIIVAMTEGLAPTNLKVHMALGGNPLVGLHCLAAADILMSTKAIRTNYSHPTHAKNHLRISNFDLFAKDLSKGVYFEATADPEMHRHPSLIKQEAAKLLKEMSQRKR